MPEEKEKSNWFLILTGLSCIAVIFCAFYFFYFQKDYFFIVEVGCDVSKETCIQRDCSDPDFCPPNGLSDFKRYNLNARDFYMCENEDCTNACESGAIKCKSIECVEDVDMGESCSSSELTEDNQ